ncbi:hypothetical protein SAMN02910263_04373, partial [Butyrivibrio sp. INlla16]
SDKDNLSDHAQPLKKREVEKPKNPDDKAAPVEKISVEELINQLKSTPLSTDAPYARLFQIFHDVFLRHSSDLGLIDMDKLVLSGDGTEVVTSARNRYRKLCNCKGRKVIACRFHTPRCISSSDIELFYFIIIYKVRKRLTGECTCF